MAGAGAGRAGPALQVGAHGGRAGVALGGLLGQGALQHVVDRRGDRRAVDEPRDRGVEVAHADLDVAAGVRRRADDRRPQHAAEGVEVGGRGGRLAAQPFGGEVGERAGDGAGGGQPGTAVLGDAEVAEVDEHLGVDAAQQDVARLEVAVDDPGGVRVGERPGHLGRDLGGLRWRHRAVLGQGLAEVATGDVLGGDVEAAVVLAVVEDLDDVRGVEPGQDGGLAREAGAVVVLLGELRREHLESHGAAQADLFGGEDDAHAAATQLASDPVAAEVLAHGRESGHGLLLWSCAVGSANLSAGGPPETQDPRTRACGTVGA